MKLNIVIAFLCEAKPIIQAFNLKKDVTEHVFQIYHNPEKSLCLIISGIGTINTAAATAYIALYHKTAIQGFLNIGCAGAALQIGALYAATKIYQFKSSSNYYPKINFINNIPSKPLATHDAPVIDYAEDTMVDMEAHGFYQTAIKFTTQEWIQVIKIISDNSVISQQAISEEKIKNLIEKQIEKISIIIMQQLDNLAQEEKLMKDPKYFAELKIKLHFSQQQCQQLYRLLQRAEILLQTWEIEAIINQAQSSQAIIKSLDKKLIECY